MPKLRLDRETLAELSHEELAELAGAAPGPRVTLNGCPWTGDPCLFTGTPSTQICG